MDYTNGAEELYVGGDLEGGLDDFDDFDSEESDLLDDLDGEDWPYDVEDAGDDWEDDDLLFDDAAEARSPFGRPRGRSRRRSYALARARQHRLAMLRRQRATRYRRPPSRRPSAQMRRTAGLAKEASLKTDVLTDATKLALQKQEQRVSRTEASLAAHAALNQVQESFPELFENDLVKTLVPLGSLALLDPKRGKGLSGLLADPRVWGPATSLLIAGIREYRNRTDESEGTNITGVPFAQLAKVGDTEALNLQVTSGGKVASNQQLFYFSMTPDIIDVDQVTGKVTAKKKGVGEVRVFTPSGEVTRNIPVSVLA